MFGKRIGKTKLRRMYRDLKFTYTPKTIYEDYKFEGVEDLFCPECGCIYATDSGNMTSYPEIWEYYHCMRCGFKVGEIDNSPFVHVLYEMKCDDAAQSIARQRA